MAVAGLALAGGVVSTVVSSGGEPDDGPSASNPDDPPEPTTTAPATPDSEGDDPPDQPAIGSDTTTPSPDDETISTTPLPPRPTTLEEWEARWATERRAIVDTLTADPYGLGDDGVLRGPGGFTLDTNHCPDSWSNRAGIEGTTVAITHYAPLSALTTAGDLAQGTRLHLEKVNDEGGIGPRGLQIAMTVTDDGFVPANTAQLVDEVLDQVLDDGAAAPEPFAISTTGSANLDAVSEQLNDRCVPLLMGIATRGGVGQPVEHPWTTGLQMTQATEAHLWVAWIERRFPDEPVSVAALVMDNEPGRALQRAFAAAAGESPSIDRIDVVRHDHTSPTVAAEMAEIAALEPDVLIAMTFGNPCLSALQEAARLGLDRTTDVRFLPIACQDPASYLRPAGGDGDGWLVLGGGVRDLSGTTEADGGADDAWIQSVRSELEGLGVDWTQGQTAVGYALRGWAMHQVLEIAASLDGGLTRTNLILAQRGLREMTHPALHHGIRFGMNGVADPFFIEGSQVARYDASIHRWILADVLDLNGQTRPPPP